MSFRKQTKASRGKCKEFLFSPFFRSSWERNCYRCLKRMGFIAIRYEKQTFKFPKPFMRTLDYKVDFDFMTGDLKARLCEVKGHFDGRSRSRLMGFAKYYPHLVPTMLIITNVNAMLKVGKRRVPAHEWIAEHLPGAEVWDYAILKKWCAGKVAWE